MAFDKKVVQIEVDDKKKTLFVMYRKGKYIIYTSLKWMSNLNLTLWFIIQFETPTSCFIVRGTWAILNGGEWRMAVALLLSTLLTIPQTRVNNWNPNYPLMMTESNTNYHLRWQSHQSHYRLLHLEHLCGISRIPPKNNKKYHMGSKVRKVHFLRSKNQPHLCIMKMFE